MVIRLLELDPDQSSDERSCVVQHGANQIPATIVGDSTRVGDLLGHAFSAEYEIDNITNVESDLPLADDSSGLFYGESGVVVDGTIHQIHDIADGSFLFDIYIRNGPEFVTVTTEQLKGVAPEIHTRIRVFANDLTVYPTFT